MNWVTQTKENYFQYIFAVMFITAVVSFAAQVHGETIAPSSSIPSSALMENPQQVFVDFENSLDRLLNEKLDLQKELESKRTEKIVLMKKLDELSSELTASQNVQTAAFEERIKIKDGRIEALTGENKKLTAEYYAILAKSNAADEVIKELQQKLNSAQEISENKIGEIKATLNAARNALAEKSLTLEQFKQDKSKIDNDFQAVNTEKEKLRAEVLSLNEKIKMTRESYSGSVNDAKAVLEEKINSLNISLEESKAALRAKEDIITKLTTQRADAEDKLKEVEDEKSEAQRLLSLSKEKLEQLARDIDQRVLQAQAPLNDKLDVLEKELKTKEEAIKNFDDEKEDLNKKIIASERERDRAKDSLAALQQTVKKQSTMTDDKIADVRTPLTAKVNDLQALLVQKEENIKDKQDQIKQLSEKQNGLSKKLASAEKERDEFRETISQLTAKTQSIPEAVADTKKLLEQEINKLNRDLKDSRQELKKKETVIDQLNSKQKELNAQLLGADQKKAALEKTIEDLQMDLEKEQIKRDTKAEALRKPLQDTIAQLRKELETQTVEINNFKSAISRAKNDLDAAVSERKELENELLLSQENLKRKESDINIQIAKVREPLERSLTKIKDDLQEKVKATDELEAAIVSLKSDKTKTEELLNETKKQLNNLEKRNAQLQTSLDAEKASLTNTAVESNHTWQEKIDAAQRNLKAADEELNSKKSEADHLRAVNQSLEGKLSILTAKEEKSDQELSVLKNELSALNKKLSDNGKTAQISLDEKIEALNTKVKDNEDALRAKDEQIKVLKAQTVKNEETIAQLTNDRAKNSSKLDGLEEENTKLSADLAALKKTYTKETADAGRKINEAQLTIAALNKTLFELQQSLDVSVQKQESLKKEFDIAAVKNLEAQKSIPQEAAKIKTSLNTEISNISNELKEAEKREKEKDLLAVSLNKKVATLNQELQQMTDLKDELEVKLKQAAGGLDELKKNVPSQIASAQSDFENKIKTIEEALKVSREESKGKDDKIKSLIKQSEDANSAFLREQKSSQELQAIIDGLNNKLDQSHKDAPVQFEALRKPLENKIAQLTTVISAYEQRLREGDVSRASLENIQKELDKEVIALSGQRNAAEAEAQEMKEKLSALQAVQSQKDAAAKVSVNEEIKQLQNKIQEANERVKSKDEAITALTVKEKSLDGELASALSAKLKLEEALQKLRLEFDAFKKDFAEQASGDMRSFTDKISNLEKDIISKATDIEKLKVDNKRLNDNLTRLTDERDSIAKKAAETEAVFKKQQESIPAWLDQARQPLQKEISSLNEELGARKKSVSDYEVKMGALLKEKESNGRFLLNVEKERDALKLKVQELQDSLKLQQEGAEEKISTVRKSLELKINELTNQLNAAKAANVQVEKIKNTLNDSLSALRIQHDQLQKEADKTASSYESLQRSSNAEVSTVQKELGDKIEELQAKLNTAEQAGVQLSKVNSSLEESLNKLNSQQELLKSDSKESKSAYQALQDSVGVQLNSVKKPLEEKVADLSSKLTLAETANTQLLKLKSGLEGSLETLSKQREKTDQELKETLNHLNVLKDKAAAELAMAKKPLQTMVDELSKSLKVSESNEVKLNKEKAELESSLKQRYAEQEKLGHDLYETQEQLKIEKGSQLSQLVAVRKPLELKIEQLTAQLKSSESAASDATKRNEELAGSLAKVEAEKAKLENALKTSTEQLKILRESVTSQVAAATKSFETKLNELSAQNKSYSDLNGQLTKSKTELENSLKQLFVNHEDLQRQLMENAQKLKTLQESVAAQLSAARKPLEDKVEILLKSMGDAQKEVKEKEAQLAKLEQKISSLEKSLNDALVSKTQTEREFSQTRSALEETRKNTNKEVETVRKPLDEKITALQKSADQKDAQFVSLKNQSDQLKKDLEIASAQVKKSGLEIAALNSQVKSQQESIDIQIRDAQKPLLAQIEEMAKSFTEKQALMMQKEDAFKKLTVERDDIEKKLESVESERNDLNIAVKSLEVKVKSIPQEVAAATRILEEDNASLKLDVAKSQGMLEVRIKGLESELENRTADLGRVTEEKRDLQSEIVRIMAERSEFAKEAGDLRSKFNANINEFCGVEVGALQKPLQDKIDGLGKQIESQSKEIEGLKEENARVNQELRENAQESAPSAP